MTAQPELPLAALEVDVDAVIVAEFTDLHRSLALRAAAFTHSATERRRFARGAGKPYAHLHLLAADRAEAEAADLTRRVAAIEAVLDHFGARP